jgi:hypothetical protein
MAEAITGSSSQVSAMKALNAGVIRGKSVL